ncbi:uncharacterized protein LOC134242268 [Saccostrea cucullata]|uniref:uncharacterized protein LOC134242268 n=1 Tax=Saccostrea cuccullata TaxID=36930 RepID=UPI002ED000BC
MFLLCYGSFIYSNFVPIIILILRINSQFCGNGKGKGPCCENYFYNSNKRQCLACPLGSYGINCSKVCVPPKYGHLCYDECYCPLSMCHIKFGCINESITIVRLEDGKELSSTRESSTISYQIDKTVRPSDDKSKQQFQYIYLVISVGVVITAILIIVFLIGMKYKQRSNNISVPMIDKDQVLSGNETLNLDEETYMEIDECVVHTGKSEEVTSIPGKNYDLLLKEKQIKEYNNLHTERKNGEVCVNVIDPASLGSKKFPIHRSHSWHNFTSVPHNISPSKTNSYLELSEDNYLEPVFDTLTAHPIKNITYNNSIKTHAQYDDFIGIIKKN